MGKLTAYGHDVIMTETSKPAPADGLLNEVNDAFSGLTLALSKGRILEETMPLLRAAGVDLLEDPEASRKLIFQPQTQMYVY
ncbi:hypothetical protein PKHYL_36070 [Psychrobacter sp. KH172YL61]|nr:hypothetical protein PKHYL_36070 [Psychrobacter sp. KH172YL61]